MNHALAPAGPRARARCLHPCRHRPGLAFAASLVTIVGFIQPAAGQDWDAVEITGTRLADNLHLLTGAGGNVAVCSGDQGLLVIDSAYAELSRKLDAAIAELSHKPVRLVVNTHWHFDHVGGNEALAKTGAVVTAHVNVRTRMASKQTLAILDREVPASPASALPALTYDDGLTLHWGGEEITLVHLPRAHTDGDTIVHFRHADVIHTGDIFFNCGYPFIDISAGGTIDGLITAVESILERCDDDTRIIPGHGPLATRSDLEAYHGMLSEFRSIVAREMAAGRDLESILASNATAPVDERWGAVFFPPEQFTEMVYRTLPGTPSGSR